MNVRYCRGSCPPLGHTLGGPGVAADRGAPSGIVPSAGDHGATPRPPVSAGLDAPHSSLFTGLVQAALEEMLRQFQPA
jgi:hypothetical protein